MNWIGDPGIAAGWTDQAAQYGIVAVPVALLMIGGEFDLSAGVMIGSSGLLLGYLTTFQDMNIWPAMVLVLLFGLVIGFINGLAVVKTKLPSFIVTLATFFVLQGVNAAGTLKLTGQTAIQDIDTASGFNSARKIFAGDLTHYDFKVKVLWWIGITLVGAWLLAKTRFGNWIYSAGGEPNAARNVGVPVARTKIALFMMTSGVAALMGIIEALELRSMQAKEGIGLEFIFIICAVVGGCLLTGGFGSVIGTFFGAAMLGMVQLGIIDAQWDSNWTFTFQGGILFAAVHAQHLIRSRAQRSEMTMAHLLEADHISKYYGNIVALNDISAHVDAGEVTCILGDNGAGKSSFIKILSGVHQADKGRLLVEGEEVHFTLAARRARGRHRDGLPGPRDGAADVDLAELLPRRRAAKGLRAAAVVRLGQGQGHRPPGAEGDGDRHPRSRPGGRHALGRGASVGRDRARGLFRRTCADPRRADVGARREAGGRRPQVHPAGARARRRRHLHHAQPASRVSGRRSLRDPEPRPEPRRVREVGDRPATSALHRPTAGNKTDENSRSRLDRFDDCVSAAEPFVDFGRSTGSSRSTTTTASSVASAPAASTHTSTDIGAASDRPCWSTPTA